jgi:hypothetical protein
VEGAGAGWVISEPDQEKTQQQLWSITISEDDKLLESETDPAPRAAYKYRLNVKKALSNFFVFYNWGDQVMAFILLYGRLPYVNLQVTSAPLGVFVFSDA